MFVHLYLANIKNKQWSQTTCVLFICNGGCVAYFNTIGWLSERCVNASYKYRTGDLNTIAIYR